jgi:hypothetical protein
MLLISSGSALAQTTFQTVGSSSKHTLPECVAGVNGNLASYKINYSDCEHTAYDTDAVLAQVSSVEKSVSGKIEAATKQLQEQVDLLSRNVKMLASANDALTKRLNLLENPKGGAGKPVSRQLRGGSRPSNVATIRSRKS